MGPTALFDKSFLQSLKMDESVWFDRFFISVVCPIFYVETLADLKKSGIARDPEDEVRIIADKFPVMHCTPTPHHWAMAVGDLLGNHVPMTGQTPLVGGRHVKPRGFKGTVFEESEEAKAFSRWQAKEFSALEHEIAHDWRRRLESADLRRMPDEFREVGILKGRCKTLKDAKARADAFVNSTDNTLETLTLVCGVLEVQQKIRSKIVNRWLDAKMPLLTHFAPFAAHVLTVDTFFRLAVKNGLISPNRPSNRVDIAYLYYLPFCHVFVSSDKLHRKCVREFLREDQNFIWGPDLKRDLSKLDKHYSAFPDSEKEKGLMKIAPYPPMEIQSIVLQLWNRHLVRSPDTAAEREPLDWDPEHANVLKDIINAPSVPQDEAGFNPQDVDVMLITHTVPQKKGSWWLLPRDIESDLVPIEEREQSP